MQARAAAIDQLVDDGILESPALPSGDLLGRQLVQLDLADEVESQLALLRQEVA